MSNQKSLLFSVDAWEKLNRFVEQQDYTSIFLICDDHTAIYCKPVFEKYYPKPVEHVTVVPSGELKKNLDSCEFIWKDLLDHGITRKSLIIILGGGVLCDMGGFCASTVLRGVDFIYIPTTLMAMADAAIGGKNGINFEHFKNQVGLFQKPNAILIETSFLNTLPDRHMRNGFVEMIKHSLIQNPAYFTDFVDMSWPIDFMQMDEWVRRSIRTKSDIVEQDFLETGIRKILNFGHTIGHAIEAQFLAQGIEILHGECIAAGMLAESYISNEKFKWRNNHFQQIISLIKPFAQNCIDQKVDMEDCILRMEKDKKKDGKQVQFSLLSHPGQEALDSKVDQELIRQSIEFLYL